MVRRSFLGAKAPLGLLEVKVKVKPEALDKNAAKLTRQKVSKKNQNFLLKIGYDSVCNIKCTWLLKVEYLLNGSIDLYDSDSDSY